MTDKLKEKKVNKPYKKILQKIGFILLGLSVLSSISIFILPFFMPTTALKIAVVGILAVLTEIFFWVGGILAGKEIINKIKYLLNFKNWVQKDENNIENVKNIENKADDPDSN